MKRKIFIMLLLSFAILCFTSCKKKLTVVFDYIYKTEEVEVKKGNKVEKPLDPIREGYTFIEWSLNGSTYDFSQKVKSDITIVAQYKKNEDQPIKPQITSLNTPQNVRFIDNKILWDAVDNATSYNVFINGKSYNTTTNSFSSSDVIKDEGFANVYVVACRDNIISNESEEILVKYIYSSDDIYKILGVKTDNETDPNILQYYNTYCMILSKYNYTINDLSKEINIEELIENDKAADYIALLKLASNADIKLAYTQLKKPTRPGLNGELQKVFDAMDEKGIYKSKYYTAQEDEKFMYVIVGCFGYFQYLGQMNPTKYTSVYDYFDKFIELQNSSELSTISYDIRKNGDNFTFISKIDNKQYQFTKDEIINILKFYYDHKEKKYLLGSIHTDIERQRVYNVERRYGEYLYELQQYQLVEDAFNDAVASENEFIKNSELNKGKFNKALKDIYTLYQDITTGKYKDYEETFNKVYNGDTSTETITKFKNQIIDIITKMQNFAKTKEDIDALFGFFESAVMTTNDINKSTIELLKIELKIMVEVIDHFAKTFEDSNIEDLQVILQLLNNPENEEAINKLKEFIDTFTNNLKNIEIPEIDSMLIIDSLDLLLKQNLGTEYKSMLSIKLGLKFTEEEMNLFIEEITKLVKYINEYPNLNSIIEQIQNLLYSENQDEIINNEEMKEFIQYLIDYITKEKLETFKLYIKAYLESSNKDYKFNSENYYTVLYENFDIIKEYYLAKSEIDIFDNDDKVENLKKSLEYVKNKFNNEEVKEYLTVLNQLENILKNKNTDITTNSFYIDFSTNIDKLISLVGKYEMELTIQDTKLINEFRKLFDNITWQYPEWFEIEIDLEDKQVNFKLKDEFLEQYPDMKILNHGSLKLCAYSYKDEGIFLYRDIELIPEIKDTMLSFSFDSIIEAFYPSTIRDYDDFEFLINKYYVSIEFAEGSTYINCVLNGKQYLHTNLSSLKESVFLNNYLLEMFEDYINKE